MKIINYFLQAIFVYIFFLIGILLPRNLSRRFFSFLFEKIGPFFKSKKIIDRNLNIFNKNISSSQKQLIISNMWKNYGITFIEYVFLKYLRKNSAHITVEGENVLKDILDKKKPVIFVSGHFSNFELMSMEITKNNIPLATIYRPLNNFFINPFMEYLRKKYVCKNQIKKGINGVRESIECIKKGQSIALMIDQRVSEGIKVDFFGKPALTTSLPAQLAIKFDLPIIPVFIERETNYNYKIKFFNPIKNSNSENKEEITKKLNQVLESMILKNPNEWIWTHNRWK